VELLTKAKVCPGPGREEGELLCGGNHHLVSLKIQITEQMKADLQDRLKTSNSTFFCWN